MSNRPLIRLIALLLVPCLAWGDFGSRISDFGSKSTNRNRQFELFIVQALSSRVLVIEHNRPRPVQRSITELLYSLGLLKIAGGSEGGPAADGPSKEELIRFLEQLFGLQYPNAIDFKPLSAFQMAQLSWDGD